MAIYLFHGDNLAQSRQLLNEFLTKEKAQGNSPKYLDGLRLTPAELEIALITDNLFTTETLVIENLFSRPRSKALADCLALICAYQGKKTLVIWDKKELTKATLKKLPQLKATLSKTPAIIFDLLDSLKPGSAKLSLSLLHQTAAQAEEGFIFIMLVRRVADLIIAKSGSTDDLSPWMRGRLITQSKFWPQEQLLLLHSHLTEIDYQLKTGGTKLGYLAHLDIILSSLLG